MRAAPTTIGQAANCPAGVSAVSRSRRSATMTVTLSGPPPRRASWIKSRTVVSGFCTQVWSCVICVRTPSRSR
ncbi:hypothetical protein ADL12_00130 [Streptomyces regalis]|uniref:Uncharacterized protein n=1 Tax=Streptomyces regalis TaxID=68262 RepID=A0A0X3VTC0_9ACTN|nr:hypothetical protein ADL12_00130 [Streptomyces regalis]